MVAGLVDIVEVIKILLISGVVLFFLIDSGIRFRKNHIDDYRNAISKVDTKKATLITKEKTTQIQEVELKHNILYEYLNNYKDYLNDYSSVKNYDNTYHVLSKDTYYLTFKFEDGSYKKFEVNYFDYQSY